MAISADSIKSPIKSRLLDMIESRREFIKHSIFLSSLGITSNGSRLYLSDCIESIAEQYIVDLCRKLTLEYANGTPAEVSVKPELYKLISENRRHGDNKLAALFRENDLSSCAPNSETDVALIECYLSAVDFEQIAFDLNQQTQALSATGLELFAGKIIHELNLGHMNSYYAPYSKGRWVICQAYTFNCYDNYRKMAELVILQNAFSHVQKDSGIQFGTALDEYMQAGKNLCYGCEKIPSRTAFGKGGQLEIHCFKEKHEFRFSTKAFEALLAFLTINGKADKVEDIMEKTNLLEAA